MGCFACDGGYFSDASPRQQGFKGIGVPVAPPGALVTLMAGEAQGTRALHLLPTFIFKQRRESFLALDALPGHKLDQVAPLVGDEASLLWLRYVVKTQKRLMKGIQWQIHERFITKPSSTHESNNMQKHVDSRQPDIWPLPLL